jgi:hypothetical protein
LSGDFILSLMDAVRFLEEVGDEFEEQTQIPLQVIILYEALDSGRQARSAFSYLVSSLQGVCDVKSRSWKFNLLENPRLQELARLDTSEADIVIVAAEGDVPLPEAVQSFIEQWLSSNPSAVGLVALFQHPQNAAVVRDYLEEAARNFGIEFFTEPGAASKQFVLSQFAFAN